MKTATQIIRDAAYESAIAAVEQGLTLAHLTGEWDLGSGDYDALEADLGRKAAPDEFATLKDEFEAYARVMLEAE